MAANIHQIKGKLRIIKLRGPPKSWTLKSNTQLFSQVVSWTSKSSKKIPTFFQMYGIDCSKQTKSSCVTKKFTQNERGVGLIVDPHTPKGPRMGLSQIQSPSIAIEGSI
jgi:hypothetical protein